MPRWAVITGDEEADEDAEPKVDTTRPYVVLICDDDESCAEALDALEEIVFQDEKIALAMHAFRTIRMTSTDAASDDLLKEHDGAIPRLVILDVAREKSTVLDKKELKTSKVYSALKKASSRFYKESLESIVKKSLKVLGEQDKLGRAEYELLAKKENLDEDDASDKKKLEKIQKELEELKVEQDKLGDEFKEIWTLTTKTV